MNIDSKEVAYKKKVGTLGSSPVIEVGLRGGLHLIFTHQNGKFEAVGAGPHRAVARFIANKRTENKIQFNDLSKADHIEPEFFEWMVPQFEERVDALNEHLASIYR